MLVIALLCLAGCAGGGHPAGQPPNVVVILIDDLGWADLGVQGSSFYETPRIDALAAEGLRFSQAYAASGVCSPTRASLLTGRYPARLRITDWIPGQGNRPDKRLLQVDDRDALPLDELTLAEAFRDAGYATAHIGKWHLGGPGHLPTDQGFDLNVAGNDRGQPPTYFYPYTRGDYTLDDLIPGGADGEYLPDRLADEAAGYIAEHRERPFFLHLAFYEVHTPLEAPDSLVAKYAARQLPVGDDERFSPHGHLRYREVQDHPVYAAMVEAMDTAVGRVLDALDAAGVAHNTIVVFTSDNGGLAIVGNPPTTNKPLRAGKGWLYEGGIRVPLIVRWPGRVAPGVEHELATSSIDLVPTLLDMALAQPAPAADGISLWPRMQGREVPERTLFWYYPHYHGSGSVPAAAVRQGRYKLVHYLETATSELYDLADDPPESRDIASDAPERVRAMEDALHAWLDAVDAQRPAANPDFVGEPPL